MRQSTKLFFLSLIICFLPVMSIVAQDDNRLTFEQLQDAIIKQNAECPISLGPTMEITSMSINSEYYTIRMTIKSIQGSQPVEIDEAQLKSHGEKVIGNFGSDFILSIINCNVGIRFAFTFNDDKKINVTYSIDDLKRILDKPAPTIQEILAATIENNNRNLPIKSNGVTIKEMKIINGNVVSVCEVDESILSFANLKTNAQLLRNNVRTATMTEYQSIAIANMAMKCGYGFGYHYEGSNSKDTIDIIFSTDEIKKMVEESPNSDYLM